MRRRDKKTPNRSLADLIRDLKVEGHRTGTPLWGDLASRLERPRRNWAEVNLMKIVKCLPEGEVALVPGKVLGVGDIPRPVTVAAVSFSSAAAERISSAGGRTLTVRQLLAENPGGSKVRILS